MIEKIFHKIEKLPYLWRSLYWAYLKYIDERFGHVIIKKDSLGFLLKELTGISFPLDDYDYLEELTDYDLTHFREDDVVLNIGAGGGLYAILAAMICRKVYVIEPLIGDVLQSNIDNSCVKDKIQVLPYAFGKNSEIVCEYWGKRELVKSKSLDRILKELNPPPTIIKCDCEGCEFDGFQFDALTPQDLESIRIIEMEYHTNDASNLSAFLENLEKHGFAVKIREKIPVPEFKFIGVLYAIK